MSVITVLTLQDSDRQVGVSVPLPEHFYLTFYANAFSWGFLEQEKVVNSLNDAFSFILE